MTNRGLYGISPEGLIAPPIQGPQGYPIVVGGPAQMPGAQVGPLVIPGLSGSPDIKPNGLLLPNNSNYNFNDEFDVLSQTPPGWSPLSYGPTTICNTVDSPSCLHLGASAGTVWSGVSKPGPLLPCTVTAKIVDARYNASVSVSNVAPGSAGTCYGIQETSQGGWDAMSWSSSTGDLGSTTGALGGNYQPLYVRLVATTSSVVVQVSQSGLAFLTIQSYTGLTWSGSIWVILGVSLGSSVNADAVFDWVRFS
jgi:hypothetical protein